MKKSIIVISIIALLIIIAGIIFLTNQETNPGVLTIKELKDKNPDSGIYSVKGYVHKIENCDCSGAGCPNCIGRYIRIADIPMEAAQLPNDLYIFTDNPDQFELGQEYIFSVNILKIQKIGDILNIELVSFEKQ